MGLSLPIIGKLLGHTQPVTTQRYAHLAADPMREAAEKIGASLNAALSGN
jgi:site-specific recombinase XerD